MTKIKRRRWRLRPRATGHIRTEIGQRIRLRYTPEIQIRFDESIERGARIFQLLREVRPGETKEPEEE